jgi:hypothetical protein
MDLHPPWHYEDDPRGCADSSKEQTFERNPKGRSPPRLPGTYTAFVHPKQ